MAKASEGIGLLPTIIQLREGSGSGRFPSVWLGSGRGSEGEFGSDGANERGQPYAVRYEAVKAMLLNEFLKAHRKVEDLEQTIALQQQAIRAFAARLDAQAAQMQEMSEKWKTNE